MKKFILSVSLYLLSLWPLHSREVPTDTIHGISMDNYKIYDDGFILDMGMKIATPMRLIPPQLTYDAHSVKAPKIIIIRFNLTRISLYGKENATIFSRGYSGFECMDSSYGFRPYASYPAKCYFQTQKRMEKQPHGEYDADGNKVRNQALPWEKNNFNGAFRDEIGECNFGIRIEVVKETERHLTD